MTDIRIRMLDTRRGTEDGFTLKQYHEGCVYTVSTRLARRFISNGVAVVAEVKGSDVLVDLLRNICSSQAAFEAGIMAWNNLSERMSFERPHAGWRETDLAEMGQP